MLVLKLYLGVFFTFLHLSLCAQSSKVDSLTKLLNKSGYDSNRVKLLSELSKVNWQLGDYDKSEEFAREALGLSVQKKYKIGESISHKNLGIVNTLTSRFDSALVHYNRAVEISRELGNNVETANTLNNIGILYENQGKYKEALEIHFSVLKLREKMNDSAMIALSHSNIGNVYRAQSNFPEALKYHFLSLAYRERVNDERKTDSYGSIGWIYQMQGKLDTALMYFTKGLEIEKKFEKKYGIASFYSKIGSVYLLKGNYDRALINYNESLAIRSNIGDVQGVAENHHNIGELYVTIALKETTPRDTVPGLLKKAVSHFLSAIKISEEIGDIYALAGTYTTLSRAYFELKDYTASRKYALKGLPLALQAGALEYTSGNYEVQAALDSATGNWQGAYNNYKNFISYRDSMSNNEVTDKVTRLEMQYDFDRKKSEAELAHAIELSKSEKKTNRIIWISSILILSAVFGFIYLRQMNKKKRLIEATNAAHRMSQLELQSLRAQLNPHFMFNSLNAIQELILKQENEKSQSYLERFAQLLRSMLENANQPFIPLRKEIDFLKLYLSLEQLRIPDLQYSINIDPSIDPDKVQTPNMMLQPYLENALWHGLQYKAGEKKLELNITKGNGRINFQVKDNGIGRKKASELKSAFQKAHKSKGMELLSKRFSLLSKEYGEDITTDIADISENGESAGTAVLISVPSSLTHQRETIAS